MILTNTNYSHKKKILSLFEHAEEITIAVAFLKRSGLDNILSDLKEFCRNRTNKITLFVGTGFGETDPDALTQLYNTIKKNPGNKLVLCTPEAGIFHAKIYIFRTGTEVTTIVGSANLTEAGWFVNDEVSVLTKTTTEALDYRDLVKYFTRLHQTYYTDDIAGLITRYKNQWNEFNDKYTKRPVFRFRRKRTTVEGINMSALREWYDIFRVSPNFIKPEHREDRYNQALKNLKILAGNRALNAQQFHDLFGPLMGHAGYERLWHSGSIQRHTHATLKYQDGFRHLVRLIQKSAHLPVNVVFERAIAFRKQAKKDKYIFGVGENIIAEIMMSFNPEKFANLNDNPITVLWAMGKDYGAPQSFNGTKYEDYVTLLRKIKNELSMKSFLEIDSLFNYIYWNLTEE